jgi:salicylate hydroxylase
MFGAPYYSIHRAHLHEALLSLVDRDRLRLGERLRGARETDTGGVRLTFEDGTVRDAGVVVGADGIHSTVREAFVRDEPVFAGLGIYRGLVPAGRGPRAPRATLARPRRPLRVLPGRRRRVPQLRGDGPDGRGARRVVVGAR